MATLHQHLIDLACENGGWEIGAWKSMFRKILQHKPWSIGADGVLATIDRVQLRPDAWRTVREGTEQGWSTDVLVLEFLEVEVGHRLSHDKVIEFANLFWALDETDYLHFRAWKMDRYGVMSPAMNEQIAYQVLAQQNV